MEEYALLFRMDITTKSAQPTTEQMKIYMKQWMDWLDHLSGQQQLADGGSHFSAEGAVIRQGNMVTEGPYTINRESVAGYINVRATGMSAAIGIARGCPILQGSGTSVEIRKLVDL